MRAGVWGREIVFSLIGLDSSLTALSLAPFAHRMCEYIVEGLKMA
jgi:hypothetical protein